MTIFYQHIVDSVGAFPGILKKPGKRDSGENFSGISKIPFQIQKKHVIFPNFSMTINQIFRKTVKLYFSFCFSYKTDQFLTKNEFEIENFHDFSEKKFR